MKFLISGVFLAVFAFSNPTASAANERRIVVAVDAVAIPATSPIVLDGKHNEEIWQQAPVISRVPAARPR